MSNPAASIAVTWARPTSPQYSRLCAVDAARSDVDVTRTHCNGSWPASTPFEASVSIVPAASLQCPACLAALAVAPALAELKHAAVIETSRVPVLFEAWDLGGDE